jgi:hypothetical protein
VSGGSLKGESDCGFRIADWEDSGDRGFDEGGPTLRCKAAIEERTCPQMTQIAADEDGSEGPQITQIFTDL